MTHFVFVVCVVKLVCVRVIQLCLYLTFGGEGNEYVELFCQCVCLCYIVLKNSITGKSNVTAFTCAVKVSLHPHAGVTF